jgi:hypothetical protein
MLKIWSDKKFHRGGECHMLIPWWGGDNPDPADPDAGRFARWKEKGSNIFNMVYDPHDADVLVYPSSPTVDPVLFAKFQNMTAGWGSKHTIAFFNDDNDALIPKQSHTWLFRTSFYKTQQRPKEYALAAWSNDWGAFEPCSWSAQPKVSFCGTYDDHGVRKAGTHNLVAHPRITTDFIIRPQFWGGWIGSGRQIAIGKRVRAEYMNNISNSGYVLCARGGGNFSFRWSETLMSGRIPVFVNTDCVLPYDFIIDWSSLFPVVSLGDIGTLGDKLYEFHQSLGPEGFIARQKELRQLWEKWLSPEGFFQNLHLHFSSKR